jgi:hypothetical protein
MAILCSHTAKKNYELTILLQFPQHFMNSFCADFLVPRKIKPKLKLKKVAHSTLVRMGCSKNVGEIDVHLFTQLGCNLI